MVTRILTERQLLSMPADSYMNEQQLGFFQTRLEAQRQELISNAAQSVSHLNADSDSVADPADRATREEEYALELRVRDRERKLLKKIGAALERINEGSYGYCLETGEPIGISRLMARPHAELCLEAQERHEIKERQRA